MTKVIAVIAMLVTTSALAERAPTRLLPVMVGSGSSAPAPALPVTSARATSAKRSRRTPRQPCRRSRVPRLPVRLLRQRRQLQGIPMSETLDLFADLKVETAPSLCAPGEPSWRPTSTTGTTCR
jgi:hypothetical protein